MFAQNLMGLNESQTGELGPSRIFCNEDHTKAV